MNLNKYFSVKNKEEHVNYKSYHDLHEILEIVNAKNIQIYINFAPQGNGFNVWIARNDSNADWKLVEENYKFPLNSLTLNQRVVNFVQVKEIGILKSNFCFTVAWRL